MNLIATLFPWVIFAAVFFVSRKTDKIETQRRQLAFERGALCGATAAEMNPALTSHDLVTAAKWVDHCYKTNNYHLIRKVREMHPGKENP